MKKILKHIIVISIITLIIVVLFEMIIMPFYVRHGKSKELVDVTLMDVKSALIMIKTSGFKGVVTDTIYTSEVEPNIVLDQHPERVLENAVRGMLPKNPLGRAMYRKLHVYAGPEHPHEAQQPTQLEL